MLKRYIIFLKKHPLITAAFAVVYAMVCIKTIRADSNFQEFILRTLLCGAMVFFLYQISGEKTLLSYTNSTWYVIKVAMGFWIFALPIGLLGLLLNAGQDAVPWDNIPPMKYFNHDHTHTSLLGAAAALGAIGMAATDKKKRRN